MWFCVLFRSGCDVFLNPHASSFPILVLTPVLVPGFMFVPKPVLFQILVLIPNIVLGPFLCSFLFRLCNHFSAILIPVLFWCRFRSGSDSASFRLLVLVMVLALVHVCVLFRCLFTFRFLL